VIFWTIPAARQNFPLNDDAAYSASLFALIRGEGIRYYQWSAMPLSIANHISPGFSDGR
jgi:hypothetical protein